MRRPAPYVLLLFALAVGFTLGGSQASGAASVVVFGDQAIEPSGDSNAAGSAEAFKTTATSTGAVATLTVYVDTGSTASSLIAGVYADASGKPGTLLGSGTLNAPAAGAWATVPVPGIAVTSGTAYWIALLAPSGTLKFRDRCCAGGSAAASSSQTTLGSLPATWTTGKSYADGPLSAYGSTAASPVLVVNPPSLSFAASVGGPNPASQTLGISNGGAGTLTWSAAKSASWLTVSPASGGGPATSTVSVATSGLAAGTYNDTITISASGAQGSPQSVPVQLVVTGPDTQPPTSPPGLAASVSGTTVALSWGASTDNLAVSKYDVYRSTTSGFAPSTANRIKQTPTTSFADASLAAGTYYYLVAAEDAAGNISAPSNEANATVAAGPPLDPLAGDQAIESKSDFNAAGAAEAFKTTASTTGTVSRITVFVDSTNTATTLVAGLYADSGGHPGALLAQGSVNAPAAGAWNDVTISSAPVTAGTAYWIALLSPAGSSQLQFRSHGAGGSPTEISTQTNLLTLPGTWSSGAVSSDGPISAWVGGTAATGPTPDQVGQWTAPINWPIVAVHMALLPTGNIIGFDAWGDAPNSQTIWNPTTGTFVPVPNATNLFCSGHVLLPDGRFMVVGGNLAADVGIKDTTIFDPGNNTWSKGANMSVTRWYPTATVLGNGKVLVFGGDSIVDFGIPYSPPYFKEASQNSLPSVYDPATNTWQDLTSSKLTTPLYPFMFQLSDGRILDAGPDVTTRVLNPGTWTWQTITTSPFDGGDAVMYLPDKVMKSGSYANTDYFGSAAYNTAANTAVIDMGQANPSWRTTAPMNFPRAFHNLTLLPDGTVLASGGTRSSDGTDLSKAVLPAEIWNPTTETWKVVASLTTGREYHSTAILLPDGRVLMAGGGQLPGRATNIYSGEIYSPPYLFKGARPTITTAPTVVNYGSSFTISTPDAANIQKVALIRTPSVTHAFDENQRYVPLSFTAGGGQLTVQTPASGNTAPPGYYMLFIVNGNGVPSVSTFVRFPSPSEDAQAPSAPGSLAATGGAGTASLSWSASTDNIGVSTYDVYRSTTSGFTPGVANKVAQTASTSFTDSGLAAATYYYVVKAEDAAGNLSGPSNQATAVVTSNADTSPPAVSVTAPAGGATVTGTVQVTASASDNVGVAGVQLKLDGNPLGTEITTPPYTLSWNTAIATNGTHSLTAVARDAAGNQTTSAAVSVTVQNTAPPTTFLFGTQTVGRTTDQDGGGIAEAFKTTSTNAGTLKTLRAYIATGSLATAVTVGLYSDNAGHPGTLLAQGTMLTPVANAWNDVAVSSTAVSSGTYWIAILSPSGNGVVKFRDATSGGAAEVSSQSTLSTLPATWSTGTKYTDGPLSAYAVGSIP